MSSEGLEDFDKDNLLKYLVSVGLLVDLSKFLLDDITLIRETGAVSLHVLCGKPNDE
jgi:hypothetical protein